MAVAGVRSTREATSLRIWKGTIYRSNLKGQMSFKIFPVRAD